MRLRRFPRPADFLEAGAAADNATWAMGLAKTLRGAQHHEDIHFENTPADVVKHYWLLDHDPDLTETKLSTIFSHNAQETLKDEDTTNKKTMLEGGKRWNSRLARDDNSIDVEMDIDLERADPKGEGTDATGYSGETWDSQHAGLEALRGEGGRRLQNSRPGRRSEFRWCGRYWTGSRPEI